MQPQTPTTINGYKITTVILVVLLLAISFYFYNKFTSISAELSQTTKSYNASVKETLYWKDLYGNSYAKTEVITTSDTKDFLALATKDSTIIKLKGLVEKYKKEIKNGGSTTVATIEGKFEHSTPTVVVENKKDTIKCNDTYTSKYFDDWSEYSIIANKDTIKLSYKYTDKLSLVIGEESDKSKSFIPRLFAPKVPFALIKSENPNNSIKDFKSYEVKTKNDPRLSAGLSAGYDVISGNAYIGVGLNYRLFYIGTRKN